MQAVRKQPRASHRKSKNGCRTCRRRHVRCDERQPQCNNCLNHRCPCDYGDQKAQDRKPPISQARPIPSAAKQPKLRTLEIKSQIISASEIPPLPVLLPIPSQNLPFNEHRLLHEISSITTSFQQSNSSRFLSWMNHTPTFLNISFSCDFVRHALLALSARNLKWRDSLKTEACQAQRLHKAAALRGLQAELNSFQRENSDSVLAASLLLSWQAEDKAEWLTMANGVFAVASSMDQWRNDSAFKSYIDIRQEMPIPPAYTRLLRKPYELPILSIADHISSVLVAFRPYLNEKHLGVDIINSFVCHLRNSPCFEHFDLGGGNSKDLNTPGEYMTWFAMVSRPSAGNLEDDVFFLVMMAHMYASILLAQIENVSRSVGMFCFQHVASIQEIDKELERLRKERKEAVLGMALEMMQFPNRTVAKFLSISA